MISAAKVKELSTLSTKDLSRILAQTGYTGCAFETAEFEGINSGGNFVYTVTYYDDAGTGKLEPGNVYVIYNPKTNDLTADY
jgi:hypothetical protein